MTSSLDRALHARVLSVVLIYAVFGALWILGSDSVLGLLVGDAQRMAQISLFKGWAFVGVTSALLYGLMRRMLRPLPGPAAAQGLKASRRPLLLAALLIVGLTAIALLASYRQWHDQQGSQIEAVAALRVNQIEAWLRERQAHARLVLTSTAVADSVTRAFERGDAQSELALQQQLAEYRQAMGAATVFVVDAGGRALLRGGAAAEPEVLAATQHALATGKVQMAVTSLSAPASLDADASPAIDMVVPLLKSGQPARAAVVMRLDPKDYLVPTLAHWPVPSRSGQTLLVRREGDQLIGLRARNPLPVSTPDLLAGKVVRGEAPVGKVLEGLDFRGTPVLGVVRQVLDTPWYLVARVERTELIAAWSGGALWIIAAGGLALFAAGVGTRALRERQAGQVAELQRAEQAEKLRALALLDGIASSSIDAIFAKDRQGRYLLFNDAACRATGKAREDVLGHDDTVVFPPEQAARIMANDAMVMTEGVTHTLEERVGAPPRSVVYLATKGPLRDEQGQVIGMFGISRDITDRSAAEQQLRKLSMAVAQSPNGIVITDLAGRIDYVNDAFVAMSGFARSELLGQLPQVLQPDSPQQWVRAAIGQSLAANDPWTGQIDNLRKDGEAFTQWAHISPIRQADGSTTHYLAIIEDITERRRIEHELDQHRHHLEALVEERTHALQSAIEARTASERFAHLIADNQPNLVSYWDRDLRCAFANRPYAAWFGKPVDAIIGRPLHEVLSPSQAAQGQARHEAVLRGEPQAFEEDLSSHDGRMGHFLTHLVPDLKDGVLAGFFVVAVDIGRVKDAERRLQQLNTELAQARDRAEGANQAKSAFLANMSHEIRTPMNAIIGLTHLLQRDSHDATASDRLDKVASAARHLLDIINDVLDLSKIEAGKLTLEQADFAVEPLLQRTLALVADRAQAKSVQLVQHTQDLPAVLCGDATRLSQALLNLLGNAIKFTAQGTVTLQAELLSQSAGQVHLRFTVVDTGIGIAADKLGRLFSAFEQADSSTTRRFGGTGLGLAITRHLAEMMQGEVGAQSIEGQGSRFWFTVKLAPGGTALPAGHQAQPPGPQETVLHGARQARQAEQALRGLRVLLAEDNPVNQEVALELLEEVGAQVGLASNGVEAVALASANAYDLILMDMQMPVMDGLQATEQIRRLPAHAHTPILAMTANAFGEDRAACLAAGMNDHIAKPVDPQQLYATMAQWARGLPAAPLA